jgi:hypothetical protein
MHAETDLLEVREGTGLGLGIFDLFQVRQRLYTGEFDARCQWRVGEGEWVAVADHPALAEVLWVTGQKEAPPDEARRVARFAGWQDQRAPGTPTARPQAPSAPAPAATGFLGRLFGKK